MALLKMISVRSDTIHVNGLDISRAPTSVIHERFFVTIPQEAILLHSATLRFNIDPSETLGNDRLVEILNRVNLWYHFASDGDTGVGNSAVDHVLDVPLSSLPTLSAGLAQPMALARALLQAYIRTESGCRPIILLDEATSSLDLSTERLMLSIIHR
jgi:ATP-binding cassette, subfamily C (CFTR/MRP), member 1